MRRVTVIAVLILMSILAAPYQSTAAEGVGKIEAWSLALIYASRYLPDDCVADSATLHRDHWESKVIVVIAKGHREPGGIIRVDRSTGEVSYQGQYSPKPRASAVALHHWYGSGHD